jgi:hypothetical protein
VCSTATDQIHVGCRTSKDSLAPEEERELRTFVLVGNEVDFIRKHLPHGSSAIVRKKPKWRELIREIRSRIADLGEVDLEAGITASRKALVEEVFQGNRALKRALFSDIPSTSGDWA